MSIRGVILLAVVEITILPVGTESPSLSKYVTKALKELDKTEVNYELTSMGTILEGDLKEILEVAKKMHESVFDEKVSRVVTTIEIDDRRDKPATIQRKKDSVKEKLEK